MRRPLARGWKNAAIILVVLVVQPHLSSCQLMGPFPRAFPLCTGKKERVTINMETDGTGKLYRHGDKVTNLPEGISVRGKRPNSPGNDAIAFDSGKKGSGNLLSKTDKMVLVIQDKFQAPIDNPGGGRLIFRFKEPLYQLDSFKILGHDKSKRSFVTAVNARKRKLDRFDIPTRGDYKDTVVSPVDWYMVSRADVVFPGEGAVSSMEVVVCRGGEVKEGCPDGARITDKGLCRPCDEGRYLTGETCERCEGNSIAPYPGATSCSPCGPGQSTNGSKTRCQGGGSCSPGTYIKGGKCKRCPPGRVSRTPNEQMCSPCPDGLEPNYSRTACIAPSMCEPGYYGSPGKCEECPSGTISPLPGQASCTRCVGSIPNPERTLCVLDNGTRDTTAPSPMPIAMAETPAPSPAIPSTPAPVPLSRCKAGYYGSGGSDCKMCPAGRITPKRQGEKCVKCPKDQASNSARTRCVTCMPGYYMDQRECVKCKEGTITKFPGKRSCAVCPPGRVSDAFNVKCVLPHVKDPSIDPCPSGTYGKMKPNCKSCPEGSITYYKGMQACMPCENDQVSNRARTACVDKCLPGYFGPGGEHCRPCPKGKYSKVAGQSKCMDCEGFMVPNSERTKCVLPKCTKEFNRCTNDRPCCQGYVCRWRARRYRNECQCQANMGDCSSGEKCCEGTTCVSRYGRQLCLQKCAAHGRECGARPCCKGSVCRYSAAARGNRCQCQAEWNLCSNGESCCAGLTCQTRFGRAICVKR